MAKKKNRRVKFTKGEKLLYMSAIFCLVGAFILQVFCGASVGNLSVRVEKLNYEIASQEKKNQSLSMKVSELTAFDKVKDIVKDMGLAYHNDNIIVVGE